MKIIVSEPKFQSLEKSLSCQSIAERGEAKLEVIEGKKYVITGGVGDGENGWEVFFANKVVSLNQYSGKLDPLEYIDHNAEVSDGKRERGYKGMLVYIYGLPYVIISDMINIYSNKKEKQLKLM